MGRFAWATSVEKGIRGGDPGRIVRRHGSVGHEQRILETDTKLAAHFHRLGKAFIFLLGESADGPVHIQRLFGQPVEEGLYQVGMADPARIMADDEQAP